MTQTCLYQMQYINVFQVFFPFHLMISWHFLTDLWFWIALWTLSYDMWMENFLRNYVPLLRNVATKKYFGMGGWGMVKKKCINNMFPNKPKKGVEFFFIMYHQNACSRGLRILKYCSVRSSSKWLNLASESHSSPLYDPLFGAICKHCVYVALPCELLHWLKLPGLLSIQ